MSSVALTAATIQDGLAVLMNGGQTDRTTEDQKLAISSTNAQDVLSALPRRRALGSGPFVGDLYRSQAWSTWMHTRRKALQAEQRLKSATESYTALRQAWNALHGLRAGDRIAISNNERKQCEGVPVHSNRWDIDGLLRLAFKSVGKDSTVRVGVGGTTHSAAAIASVAGIATSAQTQRMQAALSSLGPGAGLVITRHYDTTPMRLRFGSFYSTLAPHARYLVPDPMRAGKWKAVPSHAFRTLSNKAMPKAGVLEVMASTVGLHWQEGKTFHSKQLHCPPCILARASASCIYRALEEFPAELSIDGIRTLAARMHVVLVHEVPDGCSANNRKKAKTASEMPANALYIPASCTAHASHRIVVAATRESEVVGDVHAIAFTCTLASHHAGMLRVLQDIINEELMWHQAEPLPEWEEQIETIMSHTICRDAEHICGKLLHGDCLPSLGPSPRQATRSARAAKVRQFLNGDPRLPRISHWCRGCCSSLEEAKQNTFHAVAEGGLIMGLDSLMPSKSRWGSFSAVLGAEIAGCMVFAILPRVYTRAHQKFKAEAEAADFDADYATVVRGKVWRSMVALQNPDRVRDMAMVAWVSCPVDHLWRRLEYLDERSNILFDLLNKDMCPFTEALTSLSRMITSPTADGPLRGIFYQYGLDIELTKKTAHTILCMAGQVWSKLALQFADWPFLLLNLVKPAADSLSFCRLFWSVPLCCLDPGCARKVTGIRQQLVVFLISDSWCRRQPDCVKESDPELKLSPCNH